MHENDRLESTRNKRDKKMTPQEEQEVMRKCREELTDEQRKMKTREKLIQEYEKACEEIKKLFVIWDWLSENRIYDTEIAKQTHEAIKRRQELSEIIYPE